MSLHPEAYLNCTPPDTVNFNEDPLFCDPDNNDYTIRDISRCAPANSFGCGLIGARNPGICLP